MENIIKRYLLEQVYEKDKITAFGKLSELQIQNKLYELLKNGKFKIDENHFNEWLFRLNNSKRLFGTYLLESGLIKDKQKIIEVTESENYSSTNDAFFEEPKTYIVEMVGSGCYFHPSQEKMSGHLVINGIYNNQMIYLARVVRTGDFTVGYCGLKDSEYTKLAVDYYRNLKRVLNLMLKTSKVEVIEDSDLGSSKIYVLNYDRQSKKNNKDSFKGIMK